MASLRKIKNCKNWIACFRDADGCPSQMSTRIPDSGSPRERAEAKRRAFEVADHFEKCARGDLKTQAQIFSSTNAVLRKVRRTEVVLPTVQTYLEGWLARQKSDCAVTTFQKYQKPIKDFIALVGPSKLMADVSVDDIAAFKDMLIEEGLTRSTVRGLLKIIRMGFREAHRAGTIQVDPSVLVKVKRVFPHRRSTFVLDEIRKLMSVADSEWKTAISLGFGTGLRLGDIARLQRFDLSPQLSYLSLVPEKRSDGERVPLIVPFRPDLRAHLALCCADLRPDDWLMPGLQKWTVSGRNGLSRQFLRLIEKAGIPNTPPKRAADAGRSRTFHPLTFHSLRHAFNSFLANAGVNQEVRMRLLDQKTGDVNDGYTHIELGTLQKAVDALPSIFE